jgi:hypothetical protein
MVCCSRTELPQNVIAGEPKPEIATALTVPQFCQMFCITPALYAALKRNHLGPREVRVGDVRVYAD